jgi:hypothetical protein
MLELGDAEKRFIKPYILSLEINGVKNEIEANLNEFHGD